MRSCVSAIEPLSSMISHTRSVVAACTDEWMYCSRSSEPSPTGRWSCTTRSEARPLRTASRSPSRFALRRQRLMSMSGDGPPCSTWISSRRSSASCRSSRFERLAAHDETVVVDLGMTIISTMSAPNVATHPVERDVVSTNGEDLGRDGWPGRRSSARANSMPSSTPIVRAPADVGAAAGRIQGAASRRSDRGRRR